MIVVHNRLGCEFTGLLIVFWFYIFGVMSSPILLAKWMGGIDI